MSLIMCDEKCKYQKEGYCYLDHTSEIKASNARIETGCAYFTDINKTGYQHEKGWE